MTSNKAHIERLHTLACQRRDNGYIDPTTGFYVLSAHYLEQRGQCCGSGCRHCPYPAAEQAQAGRAEIREEETDAAENNILKKSSIAQIFRRS